MQKLDLRNNLHELINGLLSNEIVKLLDSPSLDGNNLMQHIINSKTAFDRASTNSQMEKVFEQFQLANIYSTNFITTIMHHITQNMSNKDRTVYLKNNNLVTFYSHHRTLIATYSIVNNLLLEEVEFFSEKGDFDISVAQNSGNLILQIIDDKKVSLSKLEAIITHIKKLIETTYLLYDKIEQENFTDNPVITMIDSGSDINLSIKIPKKAANLLAQIIKQFWDVIVNNKSFRHNQKLKDVESAITIMGKIDEAQKSSKIEPEMAQLLKKGVFENTKELILNNTLTKEIVLETKELSNRQILLEQTKIYQLEHVKIDKVEDELDDSNK